MHLSEGRHSCSAAELQQPSGTRQRVAAVPSTREAKKQGFERVNDSSGGMKQIHLQHLPHASSRPRCAVAAISRSAPSKHTRESSFPRESEGNRAA